MRGSRAILTVAGLPSDCQNFVRPFQDSISSLQVNAGFRCTFFMYVFIGIVKLETNIGSVLVILHSDINCGGGKLVVRSGEVFNNLKGTAFQDKITSFSCISKYLLRLTPVITKENAHRRIISHCSAHRLLTLPGTR